MIYLKDVPEWPHGVAVCADGVYDEVLGEAYPLNLSAQRLLGLVDGRRSIKEIAAIVAESEMAPVSEVEVHSLAFFTELNGAFLMNIKKHSMWRRVLEWIWVIAHHPSVLRALRWQVNSRAHVARDASPYSLLLRVAPEVLYAYGWWSSLLVISLAGAGLSGLVFGTFLATVFLGSVIVHEWVHLMALRLSGNRQRMAFLGRTLLTVGVYRRQMSPRAEMVVAASGPLVPASVGLALGIIGYRSGSVIVTAASGIMLLHLLCLLPLAQDGRNLVGAWRRMKKEGERRVQPSHD